MSSEKTVKSRSMKVRRYGSVPLAPVPAGIEMVDTPAAVTHLLPRESEVVVDEETRVTAGQPLCNGAVHGAFAAATGRVRRVMPWDGGPRGSFTAVCIDCESSDDRFRLCDPVADPATVEPSLLRTACASLGFHVSDTGTALLVNALDDDVGSVTNRWFLEKEFDRVTAGLHIINRIYGSGTVHIAVPDTLPADRRRTLADFGRVLPVVPWYPFVLSACIARSNGIAGTGGTVAVIDAKRLALMAMALQSGSAVTIMQVSLRVGRKGQTRLFQVPIGIRVGDFLAGRGISVNGGMQVVLGGEMRGTAADCLDQPLTPDSDALLVLSAREVVTPENTPCVNCGRCCSVCPAGLRVDLLGKCVEFSRDGELGRLGIDQCIDCGMCAAVCMVRRPLAHLMAYGKRCAEKRPGGGKQ